MCHTEEIICRGLKCFHSSAGSTLACALCPVMQDMTRWATCDHQPPNHLALCFYTHICGCIATCLGSNAFIMHAKLVSIALLCCGTPLPLSYEHPWTTQLQTRHNWLTCHLMPCRIPLPLSCEHPWMTKLQTQHRNQSIKDRIQWSLIKQQWIQTSCMAPQTWRTNLHSKASVERPLGVHNRWVGSHAACHYLLLLCLYKPFVPSRQCKRGHSMCMQDCQTNVMICTCFFL